MKNIEIEKVILIEFMNLLMKNLEEMDMLSIG